MALTYNVARPAGVRFNTVTVTPSSEACRPELDAMTAGNRVGTDVQLGEIAAALFLVVTTRQ